MAKTQSQAMIGATILLAMTAIVAKADALDTIKSRGKLICGTLSNVAPLGFQDPKTRELVGHEVDYCKAIASALGVAVELKPLSLAARIPEIQQGNVDIVVAGLGYTEERAKQIEYSNTYFVSRQVISVKESSAIKTFSDLNDKKISAPQNSTSAKYVKDLLPAAELVEFQDSSAAFLAFQQGRVDAISFGEVAVAGFRSKAQFPFRSLPEPLMSENYGIGMKKGENTLRDAINKVIANVEVSGQAAQIFNSWFGPETTYKIERSFKIGTPIENKS